MGEIWGDSQQLLLTDLTHHRTRPSTPELTTLLWILASFLKTCKGQITTSWMRMNSLHSVYHLRRKRDSTTSLRYKVTGVKSIQKVLYGACIVSVFPCAFSCCSIMSCQYSIPACYPLMIQSIVWKSHRDKDGYRSHKWVHNWKSDMT